MENIQRAVGLCKVVIDLRTPWLVQLVEALSTVTPVVAYSPQISAFAAVHSGVIEDRRCAALTVVRFPVQRGYFSLAGRLWATAFEERRILKVLKEIPLGTTDEAVLICCFPHYAAVAEAWRGPVVYYVSDVFRHYAGWNPEQIAKLERRMCFRAELVCAQTERIAEVLRKECGVEERRMVVISSGVSKESLLPEPATRPAELPADTRSIRRPVAGVIGNLAENMDWLLIERAVEATPWLSWLFVGPYSMAIRDSAQRKARARLLERARNQVVFIGSRPVSQLMSYARALDVAILPYYKTEPSWSGSSTRFREHLAATRPILCSDGRAELLTREPLVKVVSGWQELVHALEELRENEFQDGYEKLRWLVSREETWEKKAEQLLSTVVARTAKGLLK